MTGNQNARSSSKKNSKKVRKEAEGQNENDMEIIEVRVTNWADVMFDEIGSAVNIWLFHVNGYYQTVFS